ncbi:Hypothetical protein PHPALM_36364 [Phytophthora palmivora]|uniref:Uncharacterized protein n=1 Tax=Phytophthora palmivora TaxID=4796 RepID=A0A2P4X057_9STRA|nr:Hypothetical protein PHPALM_36364 [Phytophthora palmivora]
MTFSQDLRWRSVILLFAYSVSVETVSLTYGNVDKALPAQKTSRWPKEVNQFVGEYKSKQLLRNVSLISPTYQMQLYAVPYDSTEISRNKLTKRARESVLDGRQEFVARLSPFYSCPEQRMKLRKKAHQ